MLASSTSPLLQEIKRFLEIDAPTSQIMGGMQRLYPRLLSTDIPALQDLREGYDAWKQKDYASARRLWLQAKDRGLSGSCLDKLLRHAQLLLPASSPSSSLALPLGPPSSASALPNAPPSAQEILLPPPQDVFPTNVIPLHPWSSSFIEASLPPPDSLEEGLIYVFVDASFRPKTQNAGLAAVFLKQDLHGSIEIGSLAQLLPSAPDNHYAEAAAILFALSSPLLQGHPLCLITDSQTIYSALSDPAPPRLHPATIEILDRICRLLPLSSSLVVYRRSRTGLLPHDLADKIASLLSGLSFSRPPKRTTHLD